MTGPSANREDPAQAMRPAGLSASATQVSTTESLFRGCGDDVSTPCNPTGGGVRSRLPGSDSGW